jgi:hypothetical protein
MAAAGPPEPIRPFKRFATLVPKQQGKNLMRIITTLAVCIGIAALAGCETQEENVVENVDANLVADNFDVPADNMVNMDMNVGNDLNNVTDNTVNNTTY